MTRILFQFLAGARDFLFSKTTRVALWPTQPPVDGSFTQGFRGTGHGNDHSPPYIMSGAIFVLCPHAFRACTETILPFYH